MAENNNNNNNDRNENIIRDWPIKVYKPITLKKIPATSRPFKVRGRMPKNTPRRMFGHSNTVYLSLKVHYGGYFTEKGGRKYENGSHKYVDRVNIHKISQEYLQSIAEKMELKGKPVWVHCIFGESLDYGLIPLISELDMDRFKRRVFPDFCNHGLSMYLVKEAPKTEDCWPLSVWVGNPPKIKYSVLSFITEHPTASFEETKAHFQKEFELFPIPNNYLESLYNIAMEFTKEGHWFDFQDEDEDEE